MFKRIALFSFCLLLSLSNAKAALITLDEAGMDSIFAQASFGNNPIDIRVEAASELVRPDLLSINNINDYFNLVGNHFGAANVVNLFFIDSLNWCGSTSPSFVGCAELPGNDLIIESVFASNLQFNAELLAHELAHNLGLAHISVSSNLMHPNIGGGTNLTASQVSTLRSNSLIQGDSNSGFFITVKPILVAAAAGELIPEPHIALLLLIGLYLTYHQRKQSLIDK